MRRMYLLSLISFSSQYRKAIKARLETVYIFSIYVRTGEIIPVTLYTFKEKLTSDINEMAKIISSLRWINFRHFELIAAALVRESEKNRRP